MLSTFKGALRSPLSWFLMLFLLTGCDPATGDGPSPDGGVSDGGGTTGDGGTTDGGGSTDGGEETPVPPEVTALEATGGFTPARTHALLLGENSSVALLGTAGTLYYPDDLGLGEVHDQVVASGLLVLDRDTGHVDFYGTDDGLPEFRYLDPMGTDFGVDVPSFVSMSWLTPDQSFIAATQSHLVRGDLGEEGRWAFEHAQLTDEATGEAVSLGDLAVSPDGTVWVATNDGAYQVDPATLQSLTHVALDGPWVSRIAVGTMQLDPDVMDPITVRPVVVIHGPEKATPDRVSVIETGSAKAVQMPLPSDRAPLSLMGGHDRVLVGVLRTTDRRGAIWAVEVRKDGSYVIEEAASPRQLYSPSTGYVVPERLVSTQRADNVFVGGLLTSKGGGGLIRLGYTPRDGFGTTPALDLIPRSNPLAELLPLQANVLEVDTDGGVWVSGLVPCTESKLGQVGLLRVEQIKLEVGWDARVMRPLVSGVRAISRDPAKNHLWLALRDEAIGLKCEGLSVQQHVCRMQQNGSCEVWPVESSKATETIPTSPGVVDIAFGPAGSETLAMTTARNALFVGLGQKARVVQTQFHPGVSLDMTRAAWGPDGALWIGSEAVYDPQLDAATNASAPQGLGLLEFSAEGNVALSRRYVRIDSKREAEVVGLPSSMVWDVLPLTGTRRALVAMGVERRPSSRDHTLGTPVDSGAAPGVALVEDADVTLVAAPADAPFEESVALAHSKSLGALVLDAAGVYAVDPETATAELLHARTWGAARPLSLAVDEDDRVAVGTSEGLWVFGPDGGAVQVLDDALGYVWSLRFEEAGRLFAGTDHGLVAVALDGAELPRVEETAPLPEPLWPVEAACAEEGCVCTGHEDCLLPLGCECFGADCACAPRSTCNVDPGRESCPCDPKELAPCDGDLECLGEPGAETCQVPPKDTCGGVVGCECTVDEDCASGFHCDSRSYLCTEGERCMLECSCTGPDVTDGCPAGYTCQSLGAGMMECVKPTTSCTDDCTCEGPDAVDGCPIGMACNTDPMGGLSCAEVGPLP